MNGIQVLAHRAHASSRAIHCGTCGQALADVRAGILSFPRDAEEQWKGWFCSVRWQPDLPGGVWEVAPNHAAKQPGLSSELEVLPAIIECPACQAGNLFDPEQLVLRPNQFVARAHGIALGLIP